MATVTSESETTRLPPVTYRPRRLRKTRGNGHQRHAETPELSDHLSTSETHLTPRRRMERRLQYLYHLEASLAGKGRIDRQAEVAYEITCLESRYHKLAREFYNGNQH